MPLSWPCLERLAHSGDLPRARALLAWRDLVHPDPTPRACNDNDPARDRLATDATLDVRPTETELLTGAGWEVTGKAHSEALGRMAPTYATTTAPQTRDGDLVRMGGLEFERGALRRYRGVNGKSYKPREARGQDRGGATPARTMTAVRQYLSLRGTSSEPQGLRRPFSDAPAAIGWRDWPTSMDRELCRYQLAAHGVSRHFTLQEARANADLPPADRGPDYILPGRQWIGGVTRAKPSGEVSQGAVDAPADDVERRIDFARLRQILGDHARTLDLAITDATSADIAMARGYSASTARKVGGRVVDAAIDAYLTASAVPVAANDNYQTKIAA